MARLDHNVRRGRWPVHNAHPQGCSKVGKRKKEALSLIHWQNHKNQLEQRITEMDCSTLLTEEEIANQLSRVYEVLKQVKDS
jgi:hypothetical protein